jgi:Cu+-exporting ATPase
MKDDINTSGALEERFLVEGMDCASCVTRIETAIKKLPGTLTASVNLATGEACVVFDPSRLASSHIKETVGKIGYHAVDLPSISEAHSHAESGRDSIYRERRIKFLVALALTLPVFTISMFLPEFSGSWWIQLVLSTPVVLWCGSHFFRGGWKAARAKAPDMNTLIALSVGTAYLYSVIVTLFPGIFPHTAALCPYFESATTIVTLVLLGGLMEIRASRKAGEAMLALLGRQAKTATVIRNGKDITVSLEEVKTGDMIRVRAGEKIPVDGIVTEGSGSVDESMMSGESMPVTKNPNDEVIGSTVAQSGSFVYRATRVGENTMLQQIVRLVERAQSTKAPIARLADTVSGYFVQGVILVAIAAFIIWYIASPTDKFSSALIPFIAVLIIACPCALGLATPTAIMVGTGRASELGILIRKGEALEKAYKLDTIVLDKTGTITIPQPRITEVVQLNGMKKTELLSFVSSVERNSSHPLAKAFIKYAGENGVMPGASAKFEMVEGKGVIAEVLGKKVIVGNKELLLANNITVPPGYGNAVFVAIGNETAGAFMLAHTMKEGTRESVAKLKAMGLDVIMMTGDNEEAARLIASEAGIEKVMSGVLPYQKADKIRGLQAEGKKVGMVGDGINDAPALAQADVGFAVSTGTDVAMEAADITLMHSDVASVVNAIELSKRTFRVIKQNLFASFFYNTLGIPIAAGILFPAFGILLSPMLGSLAMAFSDVSVIANSLRLRRFS